MSHSQSLPKFFITHSFKDNPFAIRLATDLRKNGLEGFFDIFSIKPGENFVQHIDEGLRDCDIYVPILSSASLKSPWCREEITAAINLSNDPSRKGRPKIISLLLENCQSDMPVFLRTRLYLNAADGYDAAIQALLDSSLGSHGATAEQSVSYQKELTGPVHFAVQGWTANGNTFPPGSEQYQAYRLNEMLEYAYKIWRELFGVDWTWQSGVPQLAVEPRAGKDINATYDRKAIRFYYQVDPVTGRTIYTCDDRGVVASEVALAIIDALRPSDWESLQSDVAALYASVGDVSALLVALNDPHVRESVLAETGGDLRKSNVATRISKDLALAISNLGHPEAVTSPQALRDAVNNFKYRAQSELPEWGPASKLSSEAHSFSRVFTGTFYDLLVNIHDQLCSEEPSLTPDAALARASHDAGRLLAQGLLLAPVSPSFRTVAQAMLLANEQVFANKYSLALRKAFVGRRILAAKEVGGGYTPVPKFPKVFKGSPTQILVGSIFFNLENESMYGDAGRVLYYSGSHELKLTGKKWGAADGAIATLSHSLTLRLDHEDRVLSAHISRVDRVQQRRLEDYLEHSVDKIDIVPRGKKPDIAKMRKSRKIWYIEFDAKGRKRLNRVPEGGETSALVPGDL